MGLIRRPVQTGFSPGEFCAGIETAAQQISDNFLSAEFAGPGEGCAELYVGCWRFQRAAFADKRFDEVEPAHAGRAFEIEPRTAPGEKFGCFAASIAQT